MAITMNSLWDFSSATFTGEAFLPDRQQLAEGNIMSPVKFRQVSRSSRYCNQHSKWTKPRSQNINFAEDPSPLFLGPRLSMRDVRWFTIPFATESSEASAEPSTAGSTNAEIPITDDQPSSSVAQPNPTVNGQTSPQTKESMSKRPPLTAREKLRAARVLSRYTESKPSKQPMGSKLLEALRESDKGKRKSGLPEAPMNLFDDSNRGLPKQGWTFEFPGGSDVLIIAISFVLISTVMLATTYIVWKAGAIHFNEY